MIPVLTWLLTLAALAPAPVSVPAMAQRRERFNDGWKFFLGDAPGAGEPSFDDSQWKPQMLPHDWAIEGPFDPKRNPQIGALPISGTGWYRKSFTVPASLNGKRFWIEFDGAMSNAHVWINGQDLGGRPYGYIGFGFDLTPYLHFGLAKEDANVIAVRLMPEDRSSRWYPGAGIYRNVWLDVTAPVHVARWGTYVTTKDVTDDQASVVVKTEIRNDGAAPKNVVLQTSILDARRQAMAGTRGPAGIDPGILPGASQTVTETLRLDKPERWDITRPYVYTVVTELIDKGTVIDRYETPLGVRTIAFDKQKGFLLNGRAMKLHGVCDHHDLGALGAAVNSRGIFRQLEILQGAGVNAIRTSHNPPAPELLYAADHLGFLVMDEAFDVWQVPKVPNGYNKYFDEWSDRDARDFIHRDRNHPSVIMWSIGNEVMEQRRPDGAVQAKRLNALFHEEDPSRPTTSAFNSWSDAIKNGLAENVDIPGFNYQPMHYEQILKEHPDWIIVGSETGSCLSSRGVYHLPLEKYNKHPSHAVSGYDIISASFGYCPDVEFYYQDKFPQILGEFVWTGFDYIGEPTPYFDFHPGADHTGDWPARSSYSGFIDLAGFPKDRYYLYQSQWTDKPMVHLLPHWNWAGHEGEKIPVMAYSNAEEVELFLNGKSLGKKKRYAETWQMPVGFNVSPEKTFPSKYRRIWDVPYAPGTLRAVATNNGKQVAIDEVCTAGPAARISLKTDPAFFLLDSRNMGGNRDLDANLPRANGDLAFVTVRIEDKNGTLVPDAENQLTFDLVGGTIAGVDNGNAATVEPFHANTRKAFSGMALLIVRPDLERKGSIIITATSPGLATSRVEIGEWIADFH